MVETLIYNIAPLYFIIALGYIAGKKLALHLETVAGLAIYVMTPVVIFGAIAKMQFEERYLLLPVIVYLIGTISALLAYKLSKKRFDDITPNLLGMGCATGNTGYFGLPVVLSIFGQGMSGVYLLMNVGIILIENTLSFFIGARGHAPPKEALMKVLRLPAIHAIWLGLLVNLAHLADTRPMIVFNVYWQYFYGGWIVIGMMIIGIALSKVKGFRVNPELLGWFFGFKFLVWPALAYGLVTLDSHTLGLFDPTIHVLLMLMSAVPLAGNIVAYAAHLNLRPSEAATAVLASTIFALFYVPFIMGFFL